MDRLDPEKNRFYIFIFDGYSNFQVAGEVFEVVFPRVHTIHREEHVLDLFFDNISDIPDIKVSDLCDT